MGTGKRDSSKTVGVSGMFLIMLWAMLTPLGLIGICVDYVTKEKNLLSPTILFSALSFLILTFPKPRAKTQSVIKNEREKLRAEIVDILKSSIMIFANALVITYILFAIFDLGYPSFENYLVIYLFCFLFPLFRHWGIFQRMLAKLRKTDTEDKLLPHYSHSGPDSEPLFKLPHLDLVVDVSWSPSRNLLATSCMDGVIRIIEVDNELKEIATIHYQTGAISSNIAWAPSAREIATAGEIVSVWEPQSGNLKYSLVHHQLFPDFEKNLIAPSTVAYSPDGDLLASSFLEGSYIKNYQVPIIVWDTHTRDVRLILEGHQGGVTGLAWSPDHGMLASAGIDRILRIWETDNGEETTQYELDVVELWNIAWSNSERRIALRSWNDEIHIWRVGEDKSQAQVLNVGQKVACIAWSPNDRSIACGCDDGKIMILDSSQGIEVKNLHGHLARVSSISWSRDGRFLASGGEDRKVVIWRAGAF